MTLEETLQLALDAIEDLKGESVRVLDVAALTTITDCMVICNGRSARHVKRLGEHLVQQAKAAGLQPRTEGLTEAEWVLVDLSGVIVHIMQPTARAYYQLEKLWDISARPAERQAEH